MATDPLEQEAIDRQASSAFWDTVSWAGGTALLFLTAVVLVVVSPGPSPYENIPATAIALFLAWKSWRKTQVANEKRKRLPPPRFLRPPVFIPPGEAQGDSTWELSDEIRPRHVWITGKSGYGKSNLMLLMALRDIGRGKGVTVIDPGADLVRFIMERLPPERLADVIYLGLDNPIPLDFMNCDDDAERELLVGDLMKTFRRLSEMAGGQWGVRMDAILRDVLYTLLNAQNVAFTDIYYFLVDKKRRSEILRQPTIPNDLALSSDRHTRS